MLSYNIRNSRRVVPSVIAGEAYAFSAAYDQAYVIKHNLKRILRQPILLLILTDSKKIFDVFLVRLIVLKGGS